MELLEGDTHHATTENSDKNSTGMACTAISVNQSSHSMTRCLNTPQFGIMTKLTKTGDTADRDFISMLKRDQVFNNLNETQHCHIERILRNGNAIVALHGKAGLFIANDENGALYVGNCSFTPPQDIIDKAAMQALITAHEHAEQNTSDESTARCCVAVIVLSDSENEDDHSATASATNTTIPLANLDASALNSAQHVVTVKIETENSSEDDVEDEATPSSFMSQPSGRTCCRSPATLPQRPTSPASAELQAILNTISEPSSKINQVAKSIVRPTPVYYAESPKSRTESQPDSPINALEIWDLLAKPDVVASSGISDTESLEKAIYNADATFDAEKLKALEAAASKDDEAIAASLAAATENMEKIRTERNRRLMLLTQIRHVQMQQETVSLQSAEPHNFANSLPQQLGLAYTAMSTAKKQRTSNTQEEEEMLQYLDKDDFKVDDDLKSAAFVQSLFCEEQIGPSLCASPTADMPPLSYSPTTYDAFTLQTTVGTITTSSANANPFGTPAMHSEQLNSMTQAKEHTDPRFVQSNAIVPFNLGLTTLQNAFEQPPAANAKVFHNDVNTPQMGHALVARQATAGQHFVISNSPLRGIHFDTLEGILRSLGNATDAGIYRCADLHSAISLYVGMFGIGVVPIHSLKPDDLAHARQSARPPFVNPILADSAIQSPAEGMAMGTPITNAAVLQTPARNNRARRRGTRGKSPPIRKLKFGDNNKYKSSTFIWMYTLVSAVSGAIITALIACFKDNWECKWAYSLCAKAARVSKPHSTFGTTLLMPDSGATWCFHNDVRDLTNIRPCSDVVMGADGNTEKCEWIGDLPITVLDKFRRQRSIIIRNVRIIATYLESLLSVNQLWTEQRINTVFGDTNSLILEDGTEVPFTWLNGTYKLRAVVNPERRFLLGELPTGARALASHIAHAKSHINKLSPNDAAQTMHSRLHLSLDKIKKLAHNTADAPRSLALATKVECQACTQANAHALHHHEVGYTPSRVGRLIHMDDAGPHAKAALGGALYFRIFIDAHSRFRLTYLLRSRTEGLEATRRFLVEFNALAGASPGTQVVQCIHSDNAPEIANSAQFNTLLLENGVLHKTSPAHIKQPNGVAERAIGTSRAVARSLMSAAHAPFWAWGCAVLQAEDILNNCNSPSSTHKCNVDGISSFQLLTGRQPNIMTIMPFGCLAIATKKTSGSAKITFGERGMRTVNLGRSREQPGAYRLWVPSDNKVIVTSDVVFFERYFPWRINDNRLESTPSNIPTPSSSTTVLSLFSGPYHRPDGLTNALLSLNYSVVEIDSSSTHGGGHNHDILNDFFFNTLLTEAKNGRYRAVFAAPPCSTFSVSRFFVYTGEGEDGGPPPVRDRDHILGLPDVPAQHLNELRIANTIVTRMVAIVEAIAQNKGDFCIENPASRSDENNPITFEPSLKMHGPIWLMPDILQLTKTHNARSVTFAQCMFGAKQQKYTTLLYSTGFAPVLDKLATKCCSHKNGEHHILAGRTDNGEWLSSQAAAYPPALAEALAAALPPLPHRSPTSSSNEEKENMLPAINKIDHSKHNSQHTTSIMTTALLGADTGPRPDGGHFQLRSRASQPQNNPADNQSKTETTSEAEQQRGPRPGGGTFNLRSRDNIAHACAVIPNSLAGRALQAIVCNINESPRGRKHALQQDREGWIKAETKEIEAHERNRSWTVILAHEVPVGRRVIRMLWIYKVKRDGTLKARLCVMGSSQKPGIDFDQTYCATMRAASLRMLTAISAALALSMWRIDFVSAYLQGCLEDGETVYCKQPEGYETTDSNGKPHVLRVEKPIYGLAQAGRRWQRSIFPWLLDFGFKQSEFDPCVFHVRQHKHAPKDLILLGCYVDDLLICTNNTSKDSLFCHFVSSLRERWEIDDEGEAVDLLNVHFARSEKGIMLHQRPYIESMVARYVPEGIPLSFQRNWTPCNGDLPELVRRAMQDTTERDKNSIKEYQQLVGALLYCATNTRPDIAYSMGMLCRAMHRPTPPLYKAALRVLYYLARHADIGLNYEADPSALIAYSDSDLGTQHSTTGWDIRWQRATISYGSKKQISVATSSCHAEIIAASEAAKEAKFYREFLSELGFPQPNPTPLMVDNTATINLAYNPEYHSRTKHIDRRHFFVRELVEQHTLQVQYVQSTENLADFFTKPLPPKSFFKLRDIIMNVH